MTDTTLLALHRQRIVALEAEVARLRADNEALIAESLANAELASHLTSRIEDEHGEAEGLRKALEDILEINRRHPGDVWLRMADRARAALSATTDTKET